MKTISLKIDEEIFRETEAVVSRLKKSRNRYINEAIDHFNQLHKRKALGEKLKKESYAVRNDSMDILKEFEDIDYVD
jgi:metal-responsive CopG/Arc/MetJ family transcriptional regulator